jgi:iron-sulfur cluster assembly protein
MSDITVTDSARDQLKLLMKEEGKPNHHLRIEVVGGGCSGLSYNMKFSNKDLEMGDNRIKDNDIEMVVNVKHLMYIMGTTLDYSTGLNGKGFEFINPNANRTCACGESFSV